MPEIWDAYRADGSKAGFDLVRDEGTIPEGIYHLVSEVLVRHRDGSLLVMRRDLRKKGYPGLWEATASGSALKGEDALRCAQRELLEETGLQGEMTALFVQAEANHTLYHGYLCVTDCAKDAVRLQEGETIDYRWLTPQAFLAFADSGALVQGQRRRFADYEDGLRKRVGMTQ